ncbi:hypothetical protein MSAN_01712700 [Mycena sanguinolenta]|uniref:N-acetyltransferase domain-containing protein n=1 Tax=Mycena sanguinolenta TaxID=230812 RepID=A0A8H6XW03_9AGAR|nr:hypothetical protein MSAN_01712700 [Mycena sanguinolenta]
MNHQGPYVREARPSDFDEISAFDARAFADDPEMNWFGGLKTAIADEAPTQKAGSLENLRLFLDTINRSVALVGGRVTVVAIPQESGPEKLVAFAAWVPPHKVIEGTLTSLRAKAHRSLFAWGFTMWWRASVIFKPTIGAIVKKALKAKSHQETDHYRLEITATDPEYQGKGYSSMLMKEGFERCGSKPITLEATTAHSRDVYAHQGFEIVESLTLGQGVVDSRGLNTKDKGAATGFPVCVMIKWPAST